MEDKVWILSTGLLANLATWRFGFMKRQPKKQGVNIEKVMKSVDENWWKEFIAS